MLRLLLFLLALVASAPAAAMPADGPACHEAPAATHAMPMAHHSAPDPAPPPHFCLGCVPVGDWLSPRLAAPVALPAPAPVARIVALDLSSAAPPLLRPPRAA